MSDDEDDYLSDKFLLGDTAPSSKPSSSRPKTYSELRKEALRASEAKQAAGRKKSKREIVEEGLNTSLFDKAKEQEAAGLGKSRALGMMMKMGFKPGQSLGRTTNPGAPVSDKEALVVTGDTVDATSGATDATATIRSSHRDEQRIEPIALNLWEGRSGIGQKRSHSSKANPYAPAKKARTSESEAKENESAEAFRERTRQEYEEKRAEARLVAATRTCLSLDQESRGLKFNILWLNPKNPNTCPRELLEAFARDAAVEDLDDDPTIDPALDALDDDDEPTPRRVNDQRYHHSGVGDGSRAARLKEQMRRDAFQSSADFDDIGQDLESYPFGLRRLQDGGVENETDTLDFSAEQVTEAREFLGLPVKDRLDRVLSYMRNEYAYCFWCGTRYRDKEDMDVSCPGEDEEAHD